MIFYICIFFFDLIYSYDKSIEICAKKTIFRFIIMLNPAGANHWDVGESIFIQIGWSG